MLDVARATTRTSLDGRLGASTCSPRRAPARRRTPDWRCPSRATCSGLGGPRDFNAAALEAGAGGGRRRASGLVPVEAGETVQWQVFAAGPRQLPDVGEADRGAAGGAGRRPPTTSADLDVARWRPEVADALMNLHHRPALEAPLGHPAAVRRPRRARAAGVGDRRTSRSRTTAARCRRTRWGSAVALLQPLDRAARRAVVAACSPEVWPP